jgi:four helix bundle protein
MTAVNSFTDLQCWQAARELSKQIFWLAKEEKFCTDRRLVEQINDSSESVMANIAEGFGRGTQGEFVTFLGYSIGSLDETRSHLCAAFDREYLTAEQFAELWEKATAIRKMTVALIRSMVQPGGGVKYSTKCQSWTDQVWETYERVTGQKRPELFEAARQMKRDAPKRDDRPPGG